MKRLRKENHLQFFVPAFVSKWNSRLFCHKIKWSSYTYTKCNYCTFDVKLLKENSTNHDSRNELTHTCYSVKTLQQKTFTIRNVSSDKSFPGNIMEIIALRKWDFLTETIAFNLLNVYRVYAMYSEMGYVSLPLRKFILRKF